MNSAGVTSRVSSRLWDIIDEYERLFMSGGIQQAVDELEQLIEYVGDRRFGSMCEIGTADGGTLWLYGNLFAASGCRFIVTDMDIRPVTRRVMKMLADRMGITFDIHECKNYQFKLREPVEFLHIDGDHSYNALMWDYHQNYPMVEDGGIIVVHDTMLMEGPIRFRLELEQTGVDVRTFRGVKTLCNCFGPGRINPHRREFGMTVVKKSVEMPGYVKR